MPKAAPSAVTQLRELLLWARKERIVLGSVCIGDVQVTVVDLGMAPNEKPERKGRRGDLFKQYAGEHAAELAEAGLADDDDDRTAVQ